MHKVRRWLYGIACAVNRIGARSVKIQRTGVGVVHVGGFGAGALGGKHAGGCRHGPVADAAVARKVRQARVDGGTGRVGAGRAHQNSI